jgi:hemoglobin/transferrin/lactoferrin receptor protein
LAGPLALLPATASAQESAPVNLDPITVTATRTPSPTRSVPVSVSVVEGEALERLQAQSVDDILRDLPNVTTIGGPRGSAELPQIRGLGSDRVIIRADGARQNFQSGHKGRLLLDPAFLKKVEVVRGPGSALYGSGALGGVISFETKDAADFLEPGDPLGGYVRAGTQSASDELSFLGAAYGQAGQFDAFAGFDYRNAENLELGDGTELAFSGFEATNALAKLGAAPLPGQRIEVAVERYDDDALTALNGNAVVTDPSEVGDRDASRQTARIGYDLAPAGWWWLDAHAVGYWTETEIEEERLSDGRRERRAVETIGTDLYNTVRFGFGEQVDNALTFGLEYFEDDTAGRTLRPGAEDPPDPADPGALPAFPDATGEFLGLYAQHELRLFDRLSLIPGLRYDSFDIASDQAGLDRSDEEVSLKFGASLDLTGFLTVFGSYGEGFNAPRPQDLFISGLHFPGGFPLFPGGPIVPDNFFVANPDLAPERTETREIGARLAFDDLWQEGDGLRLELAYFTTDAEDFIARDVDIIGGTTSFANIDQAELDGIEAGLRYDTGTLFGGLGYSQVRGDDLVDGGPLPDMPADEWVLDLGVCLPERAVTIGYRGTYAEDQDRVASDEAPTDSYLVHDVYISWTGTEGAWDGAEVGFRINNLLDEDYRRAGSVIKEAGTDFRITVGMRF